MIRSVSLSLMIASLCLPAAAMAKGTGYECAIKAPGNNGWLPEVLFIGHDTTSHAVVVSDPIILYYNDRQPIQGRVKTDNAKRTTFAWKLDAKSNSNQRVTITYTATYLKGSGEVTMQAMPLGYANIFHGKGRCEVKTLK
ncbi:hypothetical protein [Tropicibacter oceani]|uniref:Uncharacterized protein n=1 Tax=Tropicibacter oceani TaxID=3058420 RepID=A0ABY8QEJ2_9RHOB|nr:hypothetical protein [Tropicibacter oceani]WGW02423.1 hypothetical protein QF118_10730 [Tropicibacter oceani]